MTENQAILLAICPVVAVFALVDYLRARYPDDLLAQMLRQEGQRLGAAIASALVHARPAAAPGLKLHPSAHRRRSPRWWDS